MAATADREVTRPVRFSWRTSRAARYRMRPLASGYYDAADTTAIVSQAARGGDLVREWAAIELHFALPTIEQVDAAPLDPTIVEARLHDGAGGVVYWDGLAWSPAGAADWNTPADVEANFAALDAEAFPRIGVEWRLRTTDRRVTPYAYGAVIAARLLFMARSGETALATGSDSWIDDVVHRTLLPLFASAAPEVTDESVAPTLLSALDYSGGVGDTTLRVREVQAVYDLTLDPNMRAPIPGVWNPATMVFTFTPPAVIPLGNAYAARLIYEPLAAYSGDKDIFTARLPQVIIEALDQVVDHGGPEDELVRDRAASPPVAIRVPAARLREYRMTVLLQAMDDVMLFELQAAVERLLDSRQGRALVSAGTGMQVSLWGLQRARPARCTADVPSAVRFDLMLRTREYHGAEVQTTLLDPTGFTLTVANGKTVLTE